MDCHLLWLGQNGGACNLDVRAVGHILVEWDVDADLAGVEESN